ncbi:MAG: tetratricopeptide repeat protein [Treponema sp.]|jgi:tetratricopeptide (TPR) repeat protein|nr:tetratricopeptide repeat protein [Treponema sp.]
MKKIAFSPPSLLLVCAAALTVWAFGSCAGWAASAEEYYSLGMAYFDMGKFEEAEKWLNRAAAADKTHAASEYNLGRIAFETGRYEDAAKHFDAVLKKDPQNVMALKAAAYTRIKTGDFGIAEGYYQRVLALTPESADDGYNYALVLFAVKKYAEAEETLAAHEFTLPDNNEALLLYARAQAAQNKIEAMDSYAQWLVNNSDPKVRYEYAQILEKAELYARALEEYRMALAGLSPDSTDPKKADLRFALGRLLLIADPENEEGIAELKNAVSEGFADTALLEELAQNERISRARRESVRALIDEAKRVAAGLEAQKIEAENAEPLETDVEGRTEGPGEG